MYSDYHFYIDFNWEDAVDKQIDIFFKDLYQLVELVHQHKSTVYYSDVQLQRFIQNINDLDADFVTSYGNQLQLILENTIKETNFRYAFQICFANENTSLNHINNNIHSVVNEHNKISIISFSNKTEHFLSVKSNIDFCRIDCVNVQNQNDIVHWITANTIRNFNLSKKHGENGTGNWKGESVLLCSKIEAQAWLDNAIPCFSDNEKRLYNFDTNHNTYIVFYYEGNNPQIQWHGFHITQAEWNDKIPNFIRKHFDKS